jgi:hypothetical protein
LYGLSACDAGRVLGSLRSFLQESYVLIVFRLVRTARGVGYEVC